MMSTGQREHASDQKCIFNMYGDALFEASFGVFRANGVGYSDLALRHVDVYD